MKDIIEYLDTYVNGRTSRTEELVYALESDALQGVYSDQIAFSGLEYSQSGFQLDMFIVSNEKIWALGSGRQRESLRKDFSSISLFRYELARRKSTGAIAGFFLFVSASGRDVPAAAIVSGICDVHLADGGLCLKEDQALCRDQPVRDGRFKPLAFQASHCFFHQGGKLHYEYDGRSFDVDPGTMQRKRSADAFPPFVSVEVDT